ncbi:hypothetical protein ACFVS2_26570 [Brevibacillus sp. NPDC058079]|uniref:hypothetical protein n=1 Tax=Brevibacillus sp. NPDC058079 TaxID=3346330 RepID=UPI0036E083ED
MERIIDVITPTNRGYNVKKVGEKMLIHEIKQFDDQIPDGVYAIPRSPGEPRVKVRKLADFCKINGITPADLSKEEMEQFLERK